MRIRFLRGWRQWKPGEVADFNNGVADMLCNRRTPRIAESVDKTAGVQTLVPPIPGLSQMVNQFTGKRKASRA